MPSPSVGHLCWLVSSRLDRGTFQSPEMKYQKFVCWEITQHGRDGKLSRPPLHPTTTYAESPPFCPDLLAEAGAKGSIGKLLPREAGQKR